MARLFGIILALLSVEVLLAGSARTAFAHGHALSSVPFEQFTSILAKTVRFPPGIMIGSQTKCLRRQNGVTCIESLADASPFPVPQWSNITSRDPSELRTPTPRFFTASLMSRNSHLPSHQQNLGALRAAPRSISPPIISVRRVRFDLCRLAVTSLALTLGVQHAARSVVQKTFDDLCMPDSLYDKARMIDTASVLSQFAYDPNRVNLSSALVGEREWGGGERERKRKWAGKEEVGMRRRARKEGGQFENA